MRNKHDKKHHQSAERIRALFRGKIDRDSVKSLIKDKLVKLQTVLQTVDNKEKKDEIKKSMSDAFKDLNKRFQHDQDRLIIDTDEALQEAYEKLEKDEKLEKEGLGVVDSILFQQTAETVAAAETKLEQAQAEERRTSIEMAALIEELQKIDSILENRDNVEPAAEEEEEISELEELAERGLSEELEEELAEEEPALPTDQEGKEDTPEQKVLADIVKARREGVVDRLDEQEEALNLLKYNHYKKTWKNSLYNTW